MYRSEVFGRSPAKPAKLDFEVASVDKAALGGKAVRKQVTVWFAGRNGGPKMDILIYLPAGAKKPAPLFVGLGFLGNDSVSLDPGVKPGEEWAPDPVTKKMVKRVNAESARGAAAERWQLDMILARGYGLATINYADIEPDFDGGMPYGICPLFFRPGQPQPAADDWAAIGAWAWGLSQAMDYLETDRDIDAKHVAVFGHSRLGKTALWARRSGRFGNYPRALHRGPVPRAQPRVRLRERRRPEGVALLGRLDAAQFLPPRGNCLPCGGARARAAGRRRDRHDVSRQLPRARAERKRRRRPAPARGGRAADRRAGRFRRRPPPPSPQGSRRVRAPRRRSFREE